MNCKIPFTLLGVAAFVAAASLPAGEASAAARQAAGGSGYSGTLSTNPTIRQQQLICDPDNPFEGSTSTEYDPRVVTLVDAQPLRGYAFEQQVELGRAVFVEVQDANEPSEEFLVSIDFFLNSQGQFRETGYVQAFYETEVIIGIEPQGGTQPLPGYTTVDQNGVVGTDTHYYLFRYLPNVTETTVATYRNYADSGERGFDTDFLVIREQDGSFTRLEGPAQLPVDATVRGSLIIPEPSALALAGAGALALLARRRRQAA